MESEVSGLCERKGIKMRGSLTDSEFEEIVSAVMGSAVAKGSQA